ncbi:MAG: efflux RND transporter periplasmic adaptor subunit [Gemmatimonadota bacterium]|nr:efflux RND transporter periplasmic adaptor subunit [Gemmatimonadota bacterium]
MTLSDPQTRPPLLAFLLVAAACGAASSDTIEATGTVEFTETAIAATSLGRVERVLVEEGDRVRAGDTLVVLVQPTLAATRAQLVAHVASARAVLADAVRGPRQAEIAAAEANLAALSAEAARTASDVTRLTPLAERDFASAQQFEAARAAASIAAARRDAAAAQLDLLREGTRPEQVAARRADFTAAEAALAVADATARDLVLLAPVSGRVITRRAEPGEVLPVGATALVLAETGRQWVRIYVGQSVLPLVRPGATLTATLDAFPDRPISGVVREVSSEAEYTPRVALTEKERADLLFGVRAEFRDTTEMLKAGLPVTVRLARPIP